MPSVNCKSLVFVGEAKRQLELCEAVAVFTSLKLAATARQAAAATRCRVSNLFIFRKIAEIGETYEAHRGDS